MSEPRTIGAYLRAARRKRRLSLERAAEDTRIRSDFLMRMESDEFDFLAIAYVRGFLRSYARYLRVDEQPLLEEFDRRYGHGRADTQQIAAIERRGRKMPRQGRRANSWAVAAVVATAGLTFLAILGLLQEPRGTRSDENVSARTESPSPEATEEPVAEESVSPSTSPEEIAFSDGIELTIDATTADCWVLITTDGREVFTGIIPRGQSQDFSARNELFVRLGFPRGVELIVNGQNLGSPGGEDPINITFPDDLDDLT